MSLRFFLSPACGRESRRRRGVREQRSQTAGALPESAPSPGATRHPLPHAGEGIKSMQQQMSITKP
ncbi:hypothetical protein WQQ_38350 [Hydrocarboniphaga effusa AP103]|uniref:Uncharacterized protein n=1 Tax=Hydrocarboniphaga effusa AP103 TaxID=1172194 RepID=I8T3Z5_9GAMM|nr:hypothetical protein WQQ_38350 [Hydrocarboniphaga effusa AP103]